MKKKIILFAGLLITLATVLVIISIAIPAWRSWGNIPPKKPFSCTLTDLKIDFTSYQDPIIGFKDTVKIKTKLFSDFPGYVDVHNDTIFYTANKNIYIKTGMTTTNILDSEAYITSIKGNRGYIAWLQRCIDEKGFPTDFHDVCVFNLKTDHKEIISPCPSSYVRSNLAIYGNYLLWNENLIGERDKKIIVHNLKDSAIQEFGNSHSSYNEPDIYKDEIVFVKQERYDNHLGYCSIVHRDLKTDVESIIAAGLRTAYSPKINRHYIVWMERKGVNYRIFSYSKKPRKISNILLPAHLKINELVLSKDKNLFFINGEKMTYIYNLDQNKWSFVKSDPAILNGLSISAKNIAWSTDKGLYYARIKL